VPSMRRVHVQVKRGAITSNVARGNTHWCWLCGQKSTDLDIYEHMMTTRGGWYGGTMGDLDGWEDGMPDEDE
jgi:hypothetical protein